MQHQRRLGRLPSVRGLGLLREYRVRAVIATLALLLVTLASLLAPQFLRIAIDDGILGDSGRALLLATSGLVMIALVRSTLNLANRYLAEWVGQHVARDLRERLFIHVGRLGAGYHNRVHSADLMTRLTSDVENVRLFFGAGIIQFGASAIALVAVSGILLWMELELAIVALAPLLVSLAVVLVAQKKVNELQQKARALASALNVRLHETLVGMRVIRTYGRERYELERFRLVNSDNAGANLRIIRAAAIQFPLYVFFANMGTLAAFWLGGLKVIEGDLSIGELVAFNAYLGFLLFPAVSIAGQAHTIARATASLGRVFEVLDTPLEIRDANDAEELTSVSGEIRFENVWFRYPGGNRDVLRNISLTIHPGQRVAIVGPSGVGKSTLVGLLARFYDVSHGAIYVDGRDVRQLTVSSLRRNVGMVLQDPVLFRGTIYENLTFGARNARQEEVTAAARAAQVESFVANLPDGYDTVIGERGLGLSGGQRQRIAIARTLLVRPRILVLDESTAAVDVETEAAIRIALEELIVAEDMTVLVIAHRLTTVQDADLVVALRDGEILATGTHEALLNNGEYRQMMALELSGE